MQNTVATSVWLIVALCFAGCANLTQRDPVQAYVVGVEPLPGEGLELRMLVKVRVQNPNDTPIEYTGVYLDMDVENRSFASGVSNASGTVPRFGESVIAVPVSVSAMRLIRGALQVFGEERTGKIAYDLSGKLAGPAFKTLRFTSSGEIALPQGMYEKRSVPEPD